MEPSAESRINVERRGHSIRDVCQSLGLSKGFLVREIKTGRLGARRLGRRLIVLEEDLRQYLEQAKTGSANNNRRTRERTQCSS